MLFNFTLQPLERVVPWGGPGAPTLHWFGLTDGQYWINAGNSTLFEYSEAAREDGLRYCDYQVVRLYEDLMDLVPYALEPVPTDLIPFISGQNCRQTMARVRAWPEEDSDLDDDQYWAILDGASTWMGRRVLDTSYLSPSTNIEIWSDESAVHLQWDNRNKRFGSSPAWSATVGSHSVLRADFVAECRSFHERLMAAMAGRVDLVRAGALAPEIAVDYEGLVREQEMRQRLPESTFELGRALTDWQAVRGALQRMGISSGQADVETI